MKRSFLPLALALSTAPGLASATAVADAMSTFSIEIVSGTSTGDDAKVFTSAGLDVFGLDSAFGFAFATNTRDAMPALPTAPAPVEAAIDSGAIGSGFSDSYADASHPFGEAFAFGAVGAEAIFTNDTSMMMDMIVEIEVMVDLAVSASADFPGSEFAGAFAGAFVGTFDPDTFDPIEDYLDVLIEAATDGPPGDSFMTTLPISLSIAPGTSVGLAVAIASDAFAIAIPLPATAVVLLAGIGGLFGLRRFS